MRGIIMKPSKQSADRYVPYTYLNLNYYLNTYLGELPPPPLDPKTKEPIGPDGLARIFPMELIRQEMTLDKEVSIPDEVRERYLTYRATPLLRAHRLERVLDTPAKIYFKYEGASPVGSHKYNTALPQAFYNKKEGVEKLVTETGAGQWGTALSLACQQFGLSCEVFMVKNSFTQKPYRKTLMELYGGIVHASPSETTAYGREYLRLHPDTNGNLGIAISEAIERVVTETGSHYALGSVLNHVLLHQTIIGQEAITQMSDYDDDPDIVIGCCGGGSNFAGLAFPYLAHDMETGRKNRRFIAVEPTSCPSLTEGEYRYDTGDTAGRTPMMKMYTMGSEYMPSPIHAGGLRYHGEAPLVSFLYEKNMIEAVAYGQVEVFDADNIFARCEGIVPAPESSHAIKHAIVEALRAKEEGKEKTVLLNLSGHGLLDLGGYAAYLEGSLS